MATSAFSHRGRRRPPVLILGAHRSGTTAMARALQILGLQIGQHLDSHREPRALQMLQEKYLQERGAAWHEPAAFLKWMQSPDARKHCSAYLLENIERHFASIFGYRRNLRGLALLARINAGRPWGWKDPRTTLFAPCWLEVFPEGRIVHVVRNPLAVAASIQRREVAFQAKGDPPTGRIQDFNYAFDLAISYIETGEALTAWTPNYRRVRFEDVQANARQRLTALAAFCGLRFTARQMAKAALSIRPDKSDEWRNLPNAGELLAKYPIAARLGYN